MDNANSTVISQIFQNQQHVPSEEESMNHNPTPKLKKKPIELHDDISNLLSQAEALAYVFSDCEFRRWSDKIYENSLSVLCDLIKKAAITNNKLWDNHLKLIKQNK